MSKRVPNVRVMCKKVEGGYEFGVKHISKQGRYTLVRDRKLTGTKDEIRAAMVEAIETLRDTRLRMPTEVQA